MIIHFCVHWRGTVFLILEPQGPWKDMHIFIHTFTQVVSDTWSPSLQSHLPRLKSTTNLSIRRPLLLLLLSRSVMSDSVRPHRGHLTRLPRPGDSPGKNTGVGCHFLLQHMKVKSESEVAQSSPTLSDPMDCSLPGSSVHGIFQARVLEWGAIAFSV